MSSRYHINDKGVPSKCNAQSDDTCPFNENGHYDDVTIALRVSDELLEEKYGLMGVMSRPRVKDKNVRVDGDTF